MPTVLTTNKYMINEQRSKTLRTIVLLTRAISKKTFYQNKLGICVQISANNCSRCIIYNSFIK